MIFEILVHDPAETDWADMPESTLSLGEWLARKPGWTPDFGDVGIRLLPTDGLVWETDNWAPLEVLEPMAVEAASRLSRGLPALLRSLQDCTPVWILFEPDGDHVRSAMLRDMESPYENMFPIVSPAGWWNPPDAPERLHAYVAANRARLLRPFDHPAAERAHLRGRTFARDPLVAALAVAAATAAKALRG